MKKRKRIIIVIALILLFILLIMLNCLVVLLNKQENNEENVTIVSDTKSVKDVIEKNNSKYIDENGSVIYLVFGKDLFDENGNSNESYFDKIIKDVIPFYESEDFFLVDEEKSINISVILNSKTGKHIVKINGIENFFENSSGASYTKVDKMKITEDSEIIVSNPYLDRLVMNSMYFSEIEDDLGEGKQLENGYTSYLNGTIKLRTVPTKAVRNIIFSSEYEGPITSKIDSGMSLREIYNINSQNAFGSLDEGYLGYKDADYYLFFYKDEVSVYSYTYNYNKVFEEALAKYLDSKDLDSFVNKLISKWKAYDYYEYDEKNKNAYILYSNRGIEIDIKNNDSKGIKLYTNYYFTDETKRYVKDGLISLDSKNDLVDKIEKQRKSN